MKKLSLFMLVMMNMAALGSVKNWPTTAMFGFSSIFFFLAAVLLFFLPSAFVSAELATTWPELGGVFIWVKKAFGRRAGFLAIWLLWMENIIWYPTMLAFAVGALAYTLPIQPTPLFYAISTLALFWGVTLLNLRGIQFSAKLSTFGVLLGTFFPGLILIFLGFFWLFSGNPSQISFSFDTFVPKIETVDELVFFTGVLLSLAGIEMNAIHASDVKNPQKNYPKATVISAIILALFSILGILSIATVVPKETLSLTSGAMQALTIFLTTNGLHFFTPILAILIFFGAISSFNAWLIGPSRGLLAAANHQELPSIFSKLNTHKVPYILLFTQGAIASLLSLLFLYMPSLNAAYWIMNALVAELYLLMYLLMFLSALRLRYKYPHEKRPYKIPFGNYGIWVACLMGIGAVLFAMGIGFLPPSQIPIESPFLYVISLLLATLGASLIPFLFNLFLKKSPE